jgi:hypothetical protein
MTKKDYITIANALKPFYSPESGVDLDTLVAIIIAISKTLSKDNPKFNPVRFLNMIRETTKAPKEIKYHPQARYIDCKLDGCDYCNKCGWTDRSHSKL